MFRRKIVPKEAVVVRKIFSLYITGHYSFEAIAYKLKKLGYVTKNGKEFSKSRIQEMLNNVVYEGIVEYKQINRQTKGLHEPIISTTIFDMAQQIMIDRGNVKLKEKGKYDFVFKGFVACPECEKPLYAAYSTSGTGTKHLYYCCRNKVHRSVNIREAIVNKAFNETIESLRIVPDVMEVVNVYVKEELEKKHKDAVNNLRHSQKVLEDIKAERVRLDKRLDKGIISEETFKEREAELEGREVIAKLAVNEDTIDYNDLITQLRMLYNFGSQISRYWEIASFDQRREILADMFTNCPKIENGKLTNLEISPLYKAFSDLAEELVLLNRGNRT